MPWAKTPAAKARSNKRYGRKHKQLRQALLAEAYGTPCTRCGQIMQPNQLLHLDHDDYDASKYRGFSHADCNIRAAARKARALQMYRKRVKATRIW